MLLKEKASGHIIEALEHHRPLRQREVDPCAAGCTTARKRRIRTQFDKQALCFLSGEDLPRCWTDPHYRDQDLARLRHR